MRGSLRLSDFGLIIGSHSGSRTISMGASSYECSFDIGQLTNGDIVCICTSVVSSFELLMTKYDPVLESGIDTLGNAVHLEGAMFTESQGLPSGESQIVFLAKDLRVGRHGAKSVTGVRFFVANLKTGVSRHWSLDGYQVELRPTPDAKEQLRRIRGGTSAALTTSITVIGPEGKTVLDKATSITTDLCMLLSLASAATVQWLYLEVIGENGQILETFRWNSKLNGRSSLPVISDMPPADLQDFISAAFPHYRLGKDQWHLARTIRHYVDAVTPSDFLEMRGLKLAILLEFLRGRNALQNTGSAFLVSEESFSERKQALLKGVRRSIDDVFGDLLAAAREEMSHHVSGFFRRTFKRSLRSLLDDLRLDISKADLQKFIDIRNSLVHQASFMDSKTHGSPWEQFLHVKVLVDRILLAILRHQGYFHDWSQHRPRDFEGPSAQGRVLMTYKS